MTINLIGPAREQRSLASPGEGELGLLRLLFSQEARYIRQQEEEAAIEAEDFWSQAEEGCAMDPVG